MNGILSLKGVKCKCLRQQKKDAGLIVVVDKEKVKR